MYSKYAEAHNYKTDIVEAAESDHGGYKEISFSVSGADAYSKLKFENGDTEFNVYPKLNRVAVFTLLQQQLQYCQK